MTRTAPDAIVGGDDDHYLRRELYERVRTDPGIFEFLQAGSLDGIWYWDLEHPEHEWLSPRFKEVFGYAPEEVPHTPEWWQANIFEDDLADVKARFEAHLRDPSVAYDQVVRYRHRDGTTVWIRCRGIAIRDDAGRPLRVLGAHTDVTALKRAEQELRDANARLAAANAALEARNDVLEQLAYVVSHDLKAPLRRLRSFGELLEEETELTGDAAEYLERMVAAGDRVETLLDGLLQYVRMVGDRETRAERIELDELVEDIVEDHAVELTASGAEVEVAALPAVEGDPSQIASLLSNLVGNAVKYRAEGRSPCIRISADEGEDGRVVIAVRDNGIGFDVSLLDQATAPFVQLHPRGDYAGVGLGLALCRRVAEAHGSRLTAESVEGAGSTFRVALRPA